MPGFILPEDKEITWDGRNLLTLPQGVFAQNIERPNPVRVSDPGIEIRQGSVNFNFVGYQIAVTQPSLAQALADLIASIPTIPGLFTAGGVRDVVNRIQEKLRGLLEHTTISLTGRAGITVRKKEAGKIVIRASAETQGDLRAAGSGVWFKAEVEISNPNGKAAPGSRANVGYAAPDTGSLPAGKTPATIGESTSFKVVDTVYVGLDSGATVLTVRQTLEASIASILPADQMQKFSNDLVERLRGKGLTTPPPTPAPGAPGAAPAPAAEEKLKDPKDDPAPDSVANFLAGVIDALQSVFNVVLDAFKTRIAAASVSSTNLSLTVIDKLPEGLAQEALFSANPEPSPWDGALALRVTGADSLFREARISLPPKHEALVLDVAAIVGELARPGAAAAKLESRAGADASGTFVGVRGLDPAHDLLRIGEGDPAMTASLEVAAAGDIFDTRQTCRTMEITVRDPAGARPIGIEMSILDPPGEDDVAKAVAALLQDQVSLQAGSHGSIVLRIDGAALAARLKGTAAAFPYGTVRLRFPPLGLADLMLRVHRTFSA